LTMSLQTPTKIRILQRKLYVKAKAEPDYRFYLLYDKIYREDILRHAYDLVKSNQGAPGVDGQTFVEIEAAGQEEWLAGIRNDLKARTYRPQPVRRVMIPKPGGGERPLGIPSIRDRCVGAAAKLVLEPIFEADLEPTAYGYRPKRSAADATRKVHRLLCDGYTKAVDADLSKYFDTIPHSDLIRCVARRIVDRDMLHLIKMWLKTPVEVRDQDGRRRLEGGRQSRRGVPQGGIVSPMLANLYMNRFLKYWRVSGQGERLQAHVVAYADDLVILCRTRADEAMAWMKSVMTRLGLSVNEAKTSLKDASRERFEFLGYSFGLHYQRKNGRRYLGASPSKRSLQRVRDKVGGILVPGNTGAWPEVRDRLNRLLWGWSNYFSYGSLTLAYRAVNHHVAQRARHFLRRRHKVLSRGTGRFSDKAIFGEFGVAKLTPPPRAALPHAST
jgi:RNA-directed DNA polymerase